MAQTSTTLSGETNHVSDITGTDISIYDSGGTSTIKSTTTALTGENLKLAVRDLITVSGTTNNNKIFTIKSVVSTTEFTVEETIATDDLAGNSFTLDHTGFVTDKAKGDGYYSKPDGIHTVVYSLINRGDSTDDFLGTCIMQGSLATTPTETDWFNISETAYTSDQSTITSSFNFTGNFVWVRAKVTCTNLTGNGAMIRSILINN